MFFQTKKVVVIHNWTLGILFRFIQLCIILYIAVFVLGLRHGYQGQERAIGVANVKLHGSSYYVDAAGQSVIMDALDTVFPQAELNSMFITSSILNTPGQQRGVCHGTDDKSEKCDKDGKCPTGTLTRNGITTGVCDTPSGYCMLKSWCPAEPDVDGGTVVQHTDNFTLFIKNSVRFAKYGYSVDNVKGQKPKKGENLFTVNDLLAMAGTEPKTILDKGCFISVVLKWDCDLDFAERREDCQPSVSALRLDDPNSPSKGFNFRYYNKYRVAAANGLVEYRDQTKVWGIRMAFLTAGVGRKFEVVPFILAFASGMALLGVAAVVADFVALNCLGDRKQIKEEKFQQCHPGGAKGAKGAKGGKKVPGAGESEDEPLLKGQEPKEPAV